MGSLQLHSVSFDLPAGAYAAEIAEMNRPKTASYYPWNFVDSAFTGSISSGLNGETIYVNYAVTLSDNISAGVATETRPGLGKGDDWSSYGSVSCTLTNSGTKPIHVSLVLRTGTDWIWEETGAKLQPILPSNGSSGPGNPSTSNTRSMLPYGNQKLRTG